MKNPESQHLNLIESNIMNKKSIIPTSYIIANFNQFNIMNTKNPTKTRFNEVDKKNLL
jgi:hypothetical protein